MNEYSLFCLFVISLETLRFICNYIEKKRVVSLNAYIDKLINDGIIPKPAIIRVEHKLDYLKNKDSK